jgi:hypothetical protein
VFYSHSSTFPSPHPRYNSQYSQGGKMGGLRHALDIVGKKPFPTKDQSSDILFVFFISIIPVFKNKVVFFFGKII